MRLKAKIHKYTIKLIKAMYMLVKPFFQYLFMQIKQISLCSEMVIGIHAIFKLLDELLQWRNQT